jgi:hypothetical protein
MEGQSAKAAPRSQGIVPYRIPIAATKLDEMAGENVQRREEFVCNNPYGGQREILSLECTDLYHPEILLKEIQSWMAKIAHREDLRGRH